MGLPNALRVVAHPLMKVGPAVLAHLQLRRLAVAATLDDRLGLAAHPENAWGVEGGNGKGNRREVEGIDVGRGELGDLGVIALMVALATGLNNGAVKAHAIR